jgi:hypothetical protein
MPNQNFVLCPKIKVMVAGRRCMEQACGKPQISRNKLVCIFLSASSVGEQPGGEKLACLLSLWQLAIKL